MTLEEHPTQQEIEYLTVFEHDHVSEVYKVGQWNVTRIEPFQKSGMHSYIPYIRVWRKIGDEPEFVHGEFCQHNVVGVLFKAPTKSESEVKS